MKLDIATLSHLKSRLEEISYQVRKVIFQGVVSDLNDISNNLKSYSLNQSIARVTDEINSLSVGLNDDFYRLIQFMENQLKSYTVTNEQATEKVDQLIELLNKTFDEKGNVVMSASAVINSMAAKETVNVNTTKNDIDGYNEGSNLQNVLISQIGNDRWNVIDETHSYFKEKGLNDEQIAAIVGNMAQESSLNLNADNGKGYKGLFQWSKSRQPKSFDLQSQLDRAWEEMSKPDPKYNKGIIDYLEPGDSVDKMTETFCDAFEAPGDNSVGKRQQLAKAAYYYIKENLSGK